MKRILPICTTLALACTLGLWAQDNSKMSDSKMSDSKMSGKMSGMKDAKFVKEAAAGGMAEVKLGQLAADKGSTDFVKQFGQKMVDDHGKANEDLKAVAEKNNMTIPMDIMPKDQALYDRLSKMSGTAFDTAYEKAMLSDHKKDVAAFEKESMSGHNSDVKEFAAKTLPTLKEHLKMIESKKMM